MLALFGRSGHRNSTGLGLDEHAEVAAVLQTMAAALDSGIVVLEGYDVILANESALALRVVDGTTLASPPLARLVRTARHDGVRVEQDLELPWNNGLRPISVTVVPVRNTLRVVLLLRDLTEARRVEAVRRDFVASVSHELKTPVGGLRLLAEAVRDAADDPAAARRFADRIVHEADRLSDLVRDLLDLSRLQGGEPLPEPSAVPVRQLIGDAVEQVRPAAEAARIDIAVGDCAGLEIWGDERSLRTALVNLLDNALAYSAPGTRIAVGTRPATSDGRAEVEISVTDQGTGISSTDLHRVFERFYRADPARSRRTGGTGLGLAITKHAVENAGGRVTVWSQLGTGSTFTMHLPAPPGAAMVNGAGHPAPVALSEPA
ncbi:MAG: HAMP domain-containing sensor histidine kinase [Pseudonocardiales bacterium]